MAESSGNEMGDKMAQGEKERHGESSSTISSMGLSPEQHLPNTPFGNMWYPWTFDPSVIGANETGLPPVMPFLIPMTFPGGLLPSRSEDRQGFQNGGGIFAVPVVPIISPFPPGALIPIPQNIPQEMMSFSGQGAMPVGQGAMPVTSQSSGGSMPAAADGDNGAAQPLPQLLQVPAGGDHIQGLRPDGPRPVVRRFHIALQIDLLLILKLAVVVYIFNQDGSRDRLLLLLLLAVTVYLYQTGALAPFLRRISLNARRAMAPPQHVRHVHPAQADVHAGGGNMQDDGAPVNAPPGPAADAAAPLDEQPGAGAGAANANQPHPQVPAQAAPFWWGFLKEVQMLVVGFVTSLLPGFHHHAD